MYRKSMKPSVSDDDEQNDSASEPVVGMDYANEPDHSVITPIEVVPAPVEISHRDVIILNHSIIEGKILVYDAKNKSQAWLVDANSIANKKGPISVTQGFLDQSERPYNWDDEIPSLFITADDVRLALWFQGYTKQQSLDVRKTVAGLVARGTLPVRK